MLEAFVGGKTCRPLCLLLAASLLACSVFAGTATEVEHGRLEVINGYRILSLDGTAEQMGAACGRLLGPAIRHVVRDMITEGIGRDREAYRNILEGSRTMARFQPREFLAELRALAESAGVSYEDLLLLQYFGDVKRCIEGPGSSSLCTSFAILPPNTRENACIVGRNFDYYDNGVGDYASIIAHYRPAKKNAFVTITWAGIANGWTLLSEKGIVVSNNTTFDARSHSLEGMSTCFLMRYVVENAKTVEEGVELVRRAPRSCSTAMLIAGGNPPNAAVVEFDHSEIAVRGPQGGFVGAANSFLKLYRRDEASSGYYGRLGTAYSLVRKAAGAIDVTTNIAAAKGVPIVSMNLHSAMIDATGLRLRVAMGRIPACELPFRAFRLTGKGLVSDEPSAADRR